MRGSRVLLTLAVSAAVVAAASNTQQLECFAVDFDGNNHDAGTNDNEDFIKCGGAGARAIQGMVEPDLDENDQPVLVADWQARGRGLFHGPEFFKEWWNGGNTTQNFWIVLELEYRKTQDKWVHDQRPFHPLKNMGFGGEGAYFSIRCTVDFVYRGGENFAFTGDDDVWIFINRKLRVDLGGLHSAMTGKIKLADIDCDNPQNPNADGCLQKGCRYPIHLFQADRCASGSNFYFETSLTPVREDEVTGICPASQHEGDICEQDSHCWNNGPADGQMYCKTGAQGEKTCERRASVAPPPPPPPPATTVTVCPASETAQINAACQCAPGSQTNECPTGMYCYAATSDPSSGGASVQACHSGPKGPSSGGATLTPCANSGSLPVQGGACSCAPASQINECAGGNYCYTAKGAATQSCFPGPKPKPMPTCPVSETSKVFVMPCRCDPASTLPECSPGKYCYGGKCHAGPNSTSGADNFCTVSGTVSLSDQCRCAASATTDDCAKGKYCYEDACHSAPQPPPTTWCVVSGTDPVVGSACRCGATADAPADCDAGKWCYNSRGANAASCQDEAQPAEDAAAAGANGVPVADGDSDEDVRNAPAGGDGGLAFDKGGLFGVEWLSPLILSVATGVVCCMLCMCLVACRCMCRGKRKKSSKMAGAGGPNDKASAHGGKQEMLPAGWTVTMDYATGAPCYSNVATGVMQWDPPAGTTYGKAPPAHPTGAPELYSNPMAQAHGRTETQLPHGWGKDYDVTSGEKYYYSERDGTTRWEPPPGSVGGSAGGVGGGLAAGIEMAPVVPKALQSHVRSGTVLPAGWGKDVDGDGNHYYYHTTTGETAWDAPTGSTGGSADQERGGEGRLLDGSHERSETRLPARWAKDVDANGNKYYYHEDGKTSWEKPPGSV